MNWGTLCYWHDAKHWEGRMEDPVKKPIYLYVETWYITEHYKPVMMELIIQTYYWNIYVYEKIQ